MFGFLPGNGVHVIPMNQGNSAEFRRDDGVWQDGGLLLHLGQARTGGSCPIPVGKLTAGATIVVSPTDGVALGNNAARSPCSTPAA